MTLDEIFLTYGSTAEFGQVLRRDVHMRGIDGSTMLHLASIAQDSSSVKLLLEAGADPDIRGDRGRSPLHEAAASGSAGCVDLLLSGGANKKLRDEDGRTAEDLARLMGHERLAASIRQFILR